ncbi:uncharacterized protein PAF06_010044 [Gastrophryne carolinensis]
MASGKLRVAVIGGGASGLCSARHILSRPLRFDPPVVFEATDRIGGTWVYDDVVDSGDHVHSSMYRDLRTNSPKELMAFPDFPFDPALPSFLHHSEVLKYLEEYTDHFSIRPHIKFNTRVVSVSPLQREEGGKMEVCWDVTFQSQGGAEPVTERFDGVMVCVGHYSHPLVPDIEGLENFQGRVLHSHNYRVPEAFSSCSVVLLGAGLSGADIAIELCPHAKHVILSHRGSSIQWIPPENFSEAPPVVRASENSLICEDGTEIMADTLIFCTGYKYNYPFLLPEDIDGVMMNQKKGQWGRSNIENHKHLESRKCFEEHGELIPNDSNGKVSPFKTDLLEGEDIVGPDVERGHLPPLYKHLIHSRYPTMCFIGACKLVIPFPLFHCQAQFFLSVLEGQCVLPPAEQMLSESRQEVLNAQNSGIPLKYLHCLGMKQWEYSQWLADTAGFEPLPPVLGNLYSSIKHYWNDNSQLYRKLKIRILNREEFVIEGELAKDAEKRGKDVLMGALPLKL